MALGMFCAHTLRVSSKNPTKQNPGAWLTSESLQVQTCSPPRYPPWCLPIATAPPSSSLSVCSGVRAAELSWAVLSWALPPLSLRSHHSPSQTLVFPFHFPGSSLCLGSPARPLSLSFYWSSGREYCPLSLLTISLLLEISNVTETGLKLNHLL